MLIFWKKSTPKDKVEKLKDKGQKTKDNCASMFDIKNMIKKVVCLAGQMNFTYD